MVFSKAQDSASLMDSEARSSSVSAPVLEASPRGERAERMKDEEEEDEEEGRFCPSLMSLEGEEARDLKGR